MKRFVFTLTVAFFYPARSNAVLRCTVRGGTYGGTLTVSLNEAGLQKLSKIRGNTLPNGAWIAADSRRTFETVYEVLEPSDSRPLIIGGRTDKYKQRWHIDGQGTYRTDKFGHWISRSRDCVIILDGRTLQERHQ